MICENFLQVTEVYLHKIQHGPCQYYQRVLHTLHKYGSGCTTSGFGELNRLSRLLDFVRNIYIIVNVSVFQ